MAVQMHDYHCTLANLALKLFKPVFLVSEKIDGFFSIQGLLTYG